ncbi:FecCD family ABC transporter permease [Arthrobacter sp. NPDC090010]|uniref:FecCD family ABC transporter permease n=1 Tax=Arthrobacter sp. NPDC090010 TaxID=3363942 RepID=UPI0037F5460C
MEDRKTARGADGPEAAASGRLSLARARVSGSVRRRSGLMLALAVVLLLAVFASLAVGARAVPLQEVLGTLGHLLTGTSVPAGGNGDEAVVLARLPRTVLAVLAGAALGLSGVVMQGVTRNPLADPGILGVNAGAACAVVFGIQFLGLATVGDYLWVAFLGAAIAMVLVYVLASLASRAQGSSGPTPLSLALAGAALSAGLFSFMSMALVTRQDTLDRFRFWQLGSVAARDWDALLPAVPFLLIGAVLALGLARPLDGLAMGDDAARALGQRVGLTRGLAGFAVVLLCGAATAIAGPIGFVGLVVPHALRRFTGPDHRWLLTGSLLAAPALVLAADVVGRVVMLPGEVPAGVLTALLGAPVFVALLRRGKGVGV